MHYAGGRQIVFPVQNKQIRKWIEILLKEVSSFEMRYCFEAPYMAPNDQGLALWSYSVFR